MRPILVLPLLFIVAACSPAPKEQTAATSEPAPAAEAAPAQTAPATGLCDAGPAQSFIGQLATDEVVAEIVKVTGSSSSRTLAPGSMATMDFNEERVNVHTDAGNVITQVACG